MIINHNISALNTHRQLSSATNAQSKSMEKLASGMRINRAGDDAAGLAISEKMRGQIRGLDQASRNSQDAISLIQTAEGALNETTDILQRMRELATQAATDTNTTNDRGEIQKEMDSLTSEINRIGNTTEFNTQKLLNGSKDSATVAQAAVPASPAKAGSVTSTGTLSTNTGDTVVVDGKTFTVAAANDAAAGEFTDLDGLIAAIGADAELSAKYTATKDGGQLKLEQKPGTESATAATITGTGGLSVDAAETVVGSAEVKAKEAVEAGSGLQFQIGANENQSLTLEIGDMRASALKLTGTGDGFTAKANVSNGTDSTGVEKGLDVSNAKNASAAITKIQTAIDTVSAERSKLGANQNRLEHTINNLGTSSENLTAAESRVRDTDMAKTMMEQTKNSILAQASQAMLAQANQQPQGVLQLLR
ncbi:MULTISPECIES: flagellin N-terminal helical domain-containing protein [Peribacillus]|uniref:Flagellin n=1 Tax=Peribacillus simplex TaxID=1478 RepID=A0AAN2PCY9_9BACI|nr:MULTISPECIES: flagellin [Peribacillus]MCP1155682.1 flagellin [Peribacillus frigoritolerans]MCT1390994.1 flagellin [Peribacillus frigoritolerans]CEG30219.1 flagellin domain-containing protein Fli [Peribacillus simplex]